MLAVFSMYMYIHVHGKELIQNSWHLRNKSQQKLIVHEEEHRPKLTEAHSSIANKSWQTCAVEAATLIRAICPRIALM